MSAGIGVPDSGRYYAAFAITQVRKPSLTASHTHPPFVFNDFQCRVICTLDSRCRSPKSVRRDS